MLGRNQDGDRWAEGQADADRRIPVFVTVTAARQTHDVATALLYEK